MSGISPPSIEVGAAPTSSDLSELFQTTTIGIHAVSEDGTILWSNEADHRLLGYTREEYVGRNIADFHADVDNLTSILGSLVRGERILNRHAVLRHKDGSVRHVLIDSSAAFAGGRFAHTRCFTRDVTEWAQQSELHDAMIRAQSDLQIGVVVCTDERVLWANEAYARLIGYDLDEILSPTFSLASILAEESHEEAAARSRERASGARLQHRFDATLVRKDGSKVRCDVSVKTLAPGATARRICVLRDVTVERREHEQLQRNDAFLTEASLRILAAGLDPDETLKVVARLATIHLAETAHVDLLEGSGSLRRVVIAHRDLLKQPMVDEFRERFAPSLRLRELIASIPPGAARVMNDVPEEIIASYADGDPEKLALAQRVGVRHAIIVPMRGRTGLLGSLTLTRAATGPFEESDVFIAKSLAARAALAYENARLHAATRTLEADARSVSERLQRVLDMAPVQVLTIDYDGRILSLNRSVRPPQAQPTRDLNAFDFVVPHDRERIRTLVQRSITTGRPVEYETQAILGPGNVRWFHTRVGPLELGGEKLAVVVTSDIEDRKRAEREIASVRAQLVEGEKLSALGSLVSGVAHEVRTPLTFLGNHAHLLRRRLDNETVPAHVREEAEQHLREIDAGIERINRLVEDLRRHTKARHDASLATLPLRDAVSDAVELFRATNRSTHELEAQLEPTRPVRVNVGSIQQVVLNLLQNAADATPPGGSLRVRTREADAGALLEVQDEGMGIAPEVQERMFEPLFTTKPDGTGLGLSIVKRIADAHAATLTCESRPGTGATFRLLFPHH